MSKSDDAMLTPSAAEPRTLDRRDFLTKLAAGAVLAPLAKAGVVASGMPDPQLRAPSNLRVVSTGTLTSSNLRYLGAMRVPAENVDMSFTYGTLTGRKVGSDVRLLMTGNTVKGDDLYEFADTGEYSAEYAQAPRMSLVKYWGNIYGNARRTWRADGTEKVGYPRYPGGIYWNEGTQLLYWVYYDTYNVTGDPDWCLGATRLDERGAAAFGPWRPSGEDKKGPWRCLQVSQHPSGALLCGSGIMSGNARSPWGPDVWAGQFPTSSTPAGFTAPDLPITKYLTYYPMVGAVNPDGSFTGPVKSCRRPGTYIFESIKGNPTLTEIDPVKNGGIGSWTQLDSISSMCWINLQDKQGVLFFGRLAGGHVWYRNAAQGNNLCTHGVSSPVDITGPVATASYPSILFYDPAALEAVHAGRKIDYTVDPVEVVNAESMFGLRSAPLNVVGPTKALGGSYFDPARRRLYVAAAQCDDSIGGLLNPLVHVFQIAV